MEFHVNPPTLAEEVPKTEKTKTKSEGVEGDAREVDRDDGERDGDARRRTTSRLRAPGGGAAAANRRGVETADARRVPSRTAHRVESRIRQSIGGYAWETRRRG